MPIKVSCACGKKLSVKDEYAGRRIKCPECGKAVSIPKAKPLSSENTEDEWDLADDEQGESDEETPSRSRRANKRGGVSGSARRGHSAGNSKTGSKRGLIIGLGVGGGLLVVLAVVWLAWPRRAGPAVATNPTNAVADSEVAAANNPGASAVAPAVAGQQPMLTSPVIGNDSNTAPSNKPDTAPTGPQPVMPRALTQQPDWWSADEPFDIAEYWVNVPNDQNAEPLYLDVLYEFHPSVEACYPPEVRQERTAATTQRFQRSYRMQVARTDNPPNRDATELDAVLAEHAVGFQKLATAQQRPRCVFEIGWDGAAQGPLVIAGREVARLGQLSVERDIARGEFDSAIRTTGIVLRFSRDLRVRTPLVTQFLADSIDTVVTASFVTPILQAPALKTAQCDALVRLLTQHESELQKINLALARLRGDYLLRRILMHDAQLTLGEFSPARVKTAFGSPCESLGAALFAGVNADKALSQALMTELPTPQLGQMLDVFVRNMQAADYNAGVRLWRERYQMQATALPQPYAGQMTAIGNWRRQHQAALASFMASVQSSIPAGTPADQQAASVLPVLEKKIAEAGAPRGALLFLMWNSKLENDMASGTAVCEEDFRGSTRRASALTLAALRRWYCSNAVAPTDLFSVCKAAGLTEVPRDPYGNGPLKLIAFSTDSPPIQYQPVRPSDKPEKFVAGECVIYSVGADGNDDRAMLDVSFHPGAKGDWSFTVGRPQSAFPPTP